MAPYSSLSSVRPIFACRLNPFLPLCGLGIIVVLLSFTALALRKAAFSAERVRRVYYNYERDRYTNLSVFLFEP
jgi:hypothetical protein